MEATEKFTPGNTAGLLGVAFMIAISLGSIAISIWSAVVLVLLFLTFPRRKHKKVTRNATMLLVSAQQEVAGDFTVPRRLQREVHQIHLSHAQVVRRIDEITFQDQRTLLAIEFGDYQRLMALLEDQKEGKRSLCDSEISNLHLQYKERYSKTTVEA